MDTKELKEFRLSLGLSQEKMARKVGVSFATWNRWETGKFLPSELVLARIKQLVPELAGGIEGAVRAKPKKKGGKRR